MALDLQKVMLKSLHAIAGCIGKPALVEATTLQLAHAAKADVREDSVRASVKLFIYLGQSILQKPVTNNILYVTVDCLEALLFVIENLFMITFTILLHILSNTILRTLVLQLRCLSLSSDAYVLSACSSCHSSYFSDFVLTCSWR